MVSWDLPSVAARASHQPRGRNALHAYASSLAKGSPLGGILIKIETSTLACVSDEWIRRTRYGVVKALGMVEPAIEETAIGSKEVLLVDDDARLTRSLARSIGHGCRLVIAHTPSEADRIVERRRVHAVVVDYHLPGRKGIQLLESILRRRLVDGAVLFTGDDDPSLAQRAKELNVELVLKPCGAEALLRGVDAALAQVTSPVDQVVQWLVAHHADRTAAEATAIIMSHRSRKAAARTLGKSRHSLRDYVRRCLDCTGARDVTELLQAFAGLIDLEGTGSLVTATRHDASAGHPEDGS